MARNFDFYSPFFSAALITSAGVRVPLWTNFSGGADTALAKKFSTEQNAAVANGLVSFPFLESLTIEMGLGFFPRMTAVLTPPFQDSRAFLDSTLVENGKTTLEAIIGYSAGTSDGPVLSSPFQALILEPDISLGRDSTITLNALGVAGYDASVTKASRSYSKKKRRAILESIAGGEDAADISDKIVAPVVVAPDTSAARIFIFGKSSEATPEVKVSGKPTTKRVRRNLYPDFSAIKPGSESDIALNEEIDVAQGWKTDWMFMLQLANEAGCWLTMGVKKEDQKEKNFVQVISIGSHLAEAPKYNLRFFDFVNGKLGPGYQTNNGTMGQDHAEGDFPILSVDSQTKQVWLPNSTKALVASGINSRTGETTTRVYSPNNASPADATGGGGTTPLPDAHNSGVNTQTAAGAAPAPKSVEAGDLVNKSRFATDFSMGIALRVTTLGIPDIFPGNVVAVRGVGNRFDFNYGVFTVRHMLGPTGFTTELELVSNTSALLSSVRKSQAKVNNAASKVSSADTKHEALPKTEKEVLPGLENTVNKFRGLF